MFLFHLSAILSVGQLEESNLTDPFVRLSSDCLLSKAAEIEGKLFLSFSCWRRPLGGWMGRCGGSQRSESLFLDGKNIYIMTQWQCWWWWFDSWASSKGARTNNQEAVGAATVGVVVVVTTVVLVVVVVVVYSCNSSQRNKCNTTTRSEKSV